MPDPGTTPDLLTPNHLLRAEALRGANELMSIDNAIGRRPRVSNPLLTLLLGICALCLGFLLLTLPVKIVVPVAGLVDVGQAGREFRFDWPQSIASTNAQNLSIIVAGKSVHLARIEPSFLPDRPPQGFAIVKEIPVGPIEARLILGERPLSSLLKGRKQP